MSCVNSRRKVTRLRASRERSRRAKKPRMKALRTWWGLGLGLGLGVRGRGGVGVRVRVRVRVRFEEGLEDDLGRGGVAQCLREHSLALLLLLLANRVLDLHGCSGTGVRRRRWGGGAEVRGRGTEGQGGQTGQRGGGVEGAGGAEARWRRGAVVQWRSGAVGQWGAEWRACCASAAALSLRRCAILRASSLRTSCCASSAMVASIEPLRPARSR